MLYSEVCQSFLTDTLRLEFCMTNRFFNFSGHCPFNISCVITSISHPIIEFTLKKKVKIVPYTFARRGVPIREKTYAEPSAYEVGWPVPFLAAFISPVLPLGTYLLLGEQ